MLEDLQGISLDMPSLEGKSNPLETYSQPIDAQKALRAEDAKALKSAEAGITSLKKQQDFNRTRLPSEQQFIAENPNVSPELLQEFRAQKQEEQLLDQMAQNIYKQKIAENLNNDSGLGDVGLSLSKGAINTGNVAYNLADIGSKINPLVAAARLYQKETGKDVPLLGKSLDDMAGLAENFGRAKDIVDAAQSDVLNLQRQEAQLKSAARNIRKNQRINERLDKGQSELQAYTGELVDDIGYFLQTSLNDPDVILDQVVETAPDLLSGIGIGKAAASQAVKAKTAKMSKDEIAAFLSSNEGRNFTQKIAAKANVGFAAAQESMLNASQVRSEVLNLSEEELANNPDYQKYLDKGMSPAAAKKQLADDAFNWSAGATAIAAAGVSKVTGSADFLGSIAAGVPMAKYFKGVLGKAAAGTVTEAAEETGQAIAGETISNQAVTKAKTGESANLAELTDGVGEAAAQGIIAGGLTGGGVGAVGGVNQSAQNVKEIPQAIKEAVVKPVDPENLDLDNPKWDANKSFNSIVATMDQYKNEPGGREKVNEIAINQINGAVAKSNALKDDLDAAIESGASEAEIAKKERKYNEAKASATELTEKYTDFVKGMINEDSPNKTDKEQVEDAFSPDATEEEVVTKTTDLNNAPNLSKEAISSAEAIAQNTSLPTYQREQAQALVDNQRAKQQVKIAVAAVNKSKDIESVGLEVIEGGPDKVGINQWLSGISAAVASKSKVTLAKNVNGLKRFAKQRADKFEQLSRIRSYFPEGRVTDADFSNLSPEQKKDIANYEDTYKKLDGTNFSVSPATFNSNLLGLLEAENNAAKTALSAAAVMSPEVKADIDQGYNNQPLEYAPVSLNDSSANTDQVLPEVSSTEQSADEAIAEDTQDVSVEDTIVSNEEFNNFVKTGEIAKDTIEQVLNKQQANQPLTLREQQVVTENIETVESILADRKTKEAVNEAQEVTNTETEEQAENTQTESRPVSSTDTETESNYELKQDNFAQKDKVKTNLKGKAKGKQVEYADINTWIKSEELSPETVAYFDDKNTSMFVDASKKMLKKAFTFKKETFEKTDYSIPRVETEQVIVQLYKDMGDVVGFDAEQIEQIALGLVSALSDNMTRIVNNDDTQIKNTLKLDRKAKVPAESAPLNEVGMRDFELHRLLGAKARSNMGFSNNPDAKIGDFTQRLDKALGMAMTNILEEMEVISFKEVEFSYLSGLEEKTYRGFHVVLDDQFIKENRPNLASILKNIQLMPAKVSTDIATYFGNESDNLKNYPTAEPPKDKKKSDHKTPLEFPDKNNDAINKYQKVKWKPNTGLLDRTGKGKLLNDNLLKGIAGYDFREDNGSLERSEHFSLIPGIKGKNQSINNSLLYVAKWKELIKDFPDQTHYYAHFGIKNQRMMMKGLFNPQNDKLHRHLSLPESVVNTKIDLTSPKEVQLFKLAVLESLGEKLNNKNLSDLSDVFDGLSNREDISLALDIISDFDSTDKISKSEAAKKRQDFFDIVKELGEELWSVDGLLAYKEYRDAVASGKNSFNTNLFREVDGVTNGVSIGTVQSAEFISNPQEEEIFYKILEKTGVYSEDSPYGSYNDYRSNPGNADNYEEAGSYLDPFKNKEDLIANINLKIGEIDQNKDAQKIRQPLNDSSANALFLFMSNFIFGGTKDLQSYKEDLNKGEFSDIFYTTESEGISILRKEVRKMMKNPTMILNYGAALNTVMFSMFKESLDSVYKNINKDPEFLPNFAKTFNAAIVSLYPENSQKGLAITPEQISNPNRFQLTDAQFKILNTYFTATFNDSMGSYLDQIFGANQRAQQVLTAKSNLAYLNYVKKLNSLVAEAQEQKGYPLSENEISDLRDSIKEFAPILLSVNGGKNINQGIYLGKDSQTYGSNYELGTVVEEVPIVRLVTNALSGDKKTKNKKSLMPKLFIDSPGVSIGALSVQHLDASIMAEVLNSDYKGLNIHDAYAGGILDTEGFSIELNKAYEKVVMNYSSNESINLPATLAAQEIENTLAYFAEKLSEKDFSKIQENVQSYLETIALYDSISDGNQYKSALTKFGNYDGTIAESVYLTTEGKAYSLDNIEEALNDIPADSRNTISGSTFNPDTLRQVRKNRLEEIPAEFNEQMASIEAQPVTDDLGNVFAYITPSNKGKYSIIARNSSQPILANNLSEARSNLKLVYNNAIKDTGLFGSAPVGFNENDYANTTSQDLNRDRINQTFNALSTLDDFDSSAHTENLKSVLESFVFKALPALNNLKLFKVENKDLNRGTYRYSGRNSDKEQNSIYISVGDQKAAFRSGMSASEVFVHELLHGSLAYSIDNDVKLRKQLRNLYLKVKQSGVGPEAFLNIQEKNGVKGAIYSGSFYPENSDVYKETYKNAQERFDYIFSNDKSKEVTNIISGKKVKSFTNPYLHEFAVFGLTNENFINALKKVDPKVKLNQEKPTVANALKRWFENVMSFLQLTKARPDSDAYALLKSLGEDLVIREQNYHGGIYHLLDNADDAVSNKLVKAAGKKALDADLKNSLLGNTPVIGQALRATQNFAKAGRKANQLVMNTLLSDAGKITNNVVKQAGLDVINELSGASNVTRPFETLRRIKNNVIDRTKQTLMADIAKALNSSMKKELTSEEGDSISHALIYTNVAELATLNEEGTYDFDMNEIKDLVGNKQARSQEINKVENDIKRSFPSLATFFTASAENLGYFMVTGEAKYQGNLALNPEVVIKDALDQFKNRTLTESQRIQAQNLIGRLSVLHALNETNYKDLATVKKLIESDSEGVMNILGTHKAIQENAKKNLFDGQSKLMRFGYTSEKLNEDAVYKTVNKNELNEAINRYGFKQVAVIAPDPADPIQEEAYVVYRAYGGKNEFDSGATSLTSLQAQGTDIYHRHLTNNIGGNKAFAGFQKVKKQKSLTSVGSRKPAGRSKLIPVRNNEGDIVEYRYMMSRVNKKTYLNRNDNFATVLGKTAASAHDKAKSAELNRELVEKAYEEFKAMPSTEIAQMILVGPNSSDPEAQRIYTMLPDDMKNHIVKTWGMNGNMYVHRDVWKHMFGQRKLTINSLSYANPEAYDGMEKVAIVSKNLMDTMLNNKYGIFAETTWQQVVSLAKDSIVIKGISTLKNNIISNQLVLLAMGIDPLTAYKWQKEAYIAAKEFERNNTRITEINYMMQANAKFANSKKLKQELTELLEEQSKNTVKDLLDAGVYQTIAEDIYTLEDNSAIGGLIEQRLDSLIDKTGETGSKIINTALLRHDTVVYDFLKEATQMSDFMARYALHKKNLSKGMDFESSVNNIVDTFVDYDTPTNAFLQYANDMGLVMFTKYFLRIQKVLFNSMKDRPFSAAMLIALQAVTGIALPDIYDGNILNPPGLNSPVDTIKAIYNNHPLGYIARQF